VTSRAASASRSSFLLTTLLAVVVLLGIVAPCAGQGSARDYENAATLRDRTHGLVLNERLSAMWIDDGSLIYRDEDARNAWSFIRVDTRTGEKRAAFDHEQVATMLSERLGRPLLPTQLPFHRFAHHEDGVLMLDEESLRVFVLSLEDGVHEVPLDQAEAFFLEPGRGRRSRDDGGETVVLFINQLDEPIELIWIDRQGGERSYATLQPGERHRQNTFAGHLWLIRRPDGGELARYRAAGEAALIIITPDMLARPEDEPQPSTDPPPQRSRTTSPDGRYEIVIREHNLHLRDTETDEILALSTDGHAEDYFTDRMAWSPDSSRLIAVRITPEQEHTIHMVESRPKDQLQPKLHSMQYLKPGDAIAQPRPRLFDVEARTEIPVDEALFDTPWTIGDFYWSEDSERFTFLYNQRGHQVVRVVEIDRDGRVRAVIREEPETFVDYAFKTLLHRVPGTNEIIWMSERSGYNHLYMVDAISGEVTHPITSGDWLVRDVQRIDDEKRQIWFRAMGLHPDRDPYHMHFGRIDFDGTNLTWLTVGDGTHAIEYSPDGEVYIDTYSRVDLPPVHELRRTSDGVRLAELARADWSQLLDMGWRPPERFVTAGRDGETDIWGVIFYPLDFTAERSYPVIENIYAGPHGHFVPKRFRSWHGSRAIAELGFIVVQIDGMGTNWRSRAFHDVCWRNVGDSGFPDRMIWIREAAATRPFMDLERIGLYGGSAGGQSTLRGLLMHGDFYKVGVADCGCHDNRMDKIWWNEAWMGWPIGDHYHEQSNVTQAHRLQGKLLLIVGELDRNVDPASTMQVVDALIRSDKDFDLIVMTGVGHGAAESPYGRRRRADFFVRHLHGREPRWTE
jgi:dipeptidyl-peptidase-4